MIERAARVPTLKNEMRQQFARRVYRLMVAKGWSQSELARHAGLPRDAISNYMRSRYLPTLENIEKIAEALGVEANDLLPAQVAREPESTSTSVEIRASARDPGVAELRIDRRVSMTTALKIVQLLNDDKLSN